MGFLKTIPPGEAEGSIREIYERFMQRAGAVPRPMVIFSGSPGLMAAQGPQIAYYQDHPALGPMLTTLIRYLTALVLDMPSCVEFNARVLEKMGLTGEQIDAIASNPANAPVNEKDGWMLAFVLATLRDPEAITESHIDNLRAKGWTDADILDALYISARMIGVRAMMRALGYERRPKE